MDRRERISGFFKLKKETETTSKAAKTLIQLSKESGIVVVFESKLKRDPEYLFEEEKHPALHMYEQKQLEYEESNISASFNGGEEA